MHSGRRSLRFWSAVLPAQAALIVAMGVASAAHGAGSSGTQGMSMAGMGNMAGMASQSISLARTAPTVLLHRRLIHVTIHNFAFKPANLVVSPGTRIVWTNTDSDPHTVDSVKNVWTSEALDTDGSFARVFRKTGRFAYYCSIHPFMHGTITVK